MSYIDNGAHPWEAEMDHRLQSLNDRIEASWAQTLKERDERHRAEMESLTKGFETRLSVVRDGPPHWADGNATPRRGSGENTKPRVAKPKPKPFNGKSENVETFFHQLFLVFRDQPHQYETDDAKILLALSYMSEGQAAKWASSITGHLERGVFPYETYEAFREDDKLPERRQWDHAIELKPDSTPFSSKVYPLTLAEQVELDKFIEEHLQTGRIRPSKSPIASPFFFVKKKDGKLRPVQDYRKLNAMTICNQYPLPLISEVLFNLRNTKRFTKLDVHWGYNNVRIKEGDEHKAAFVTNRGLYEPLVMFFGLTNSPATFQNMMNDIFRDLIMEGHVIVYMDDILIFTKDMETH